MSKKKNKPTSSDSAVQNSVENKQTENKGKRVVIEETQIITKSQMKEQQKIEIELLENEKINKEPQNSATKETQVVVEKSKPEKKKKLYKPMHILVPFTLVITILIVAFCAQRVLSTFQQSGAPIFDNGQEVEWKNIVGMNEQEVVALLDAPPYDKLVKEYVYEYNSDQDTVGQVTAQKPSPKTIKATQKVVITVNKGAEDILVPDVTGKTKEEAKQLLKEVGIVAYFNTVYDTNGTIGMVVSTEPSAGKTVSTADGGNKVIVNIAGKRIGEETVTVPRFTGMASLAVAQNSANERNLDLVIRRVAATTEEEIGSIVSQSPKAGSTVKVFSPVTITVAVDPATLVEEVPAA